MRDLEDLDLFLSLTSPLWWVALMIGFTMLFHDFRAGGALAIMLQGLYLIIRSKRGEKND